MTAKDDAGLEDGEEDLGGNKANQAPPTSTVMAAGWEDDDSLEEIDTPVENQSLVEQND